MKYEFLDGYRFEANTAREVCEALWHSMKFKLEPTVEAWMQANAKVMANMRGAELRTDTCENHVADMLATGVLLQID